MFDGIDVRADPFAPLDHDSATVTAPDAAAAQVTPEPWVPQLPAPEEPPAVREIRHWHYGPAAARWVYRDSGGRPLFAVARFDRPDGGKEVLPYSYGQRVSTPGQEVRHGTMDWQFKRPPQPLPLYGLHRLAQRPAAPVLVVEGEKTADAAAEMFPDLVVVTSQGGSNAAEGTDWAPLAGRAVTLWGDHDEPGRRYVNAVQRLANAAGAAKVSIVQIPAAWPEGWDLADPLPEGTTVDTVHALLRNARPAEPPRLPPGFAFVHTGTQPGLYFAPPAVDDSDLPVPVFVAAPFDVEGEANDGTGKDWGVVLGWRDRDGHSHRWALPKRMVHEHGNGIAAELEAAGLTCGVNPRAHELLKQFIGSVQTSRRLQCVSRSGWHRGAKGPVFVLSGGHAFGPGAGDIILQADHAGGDGAFASAGTLADWQREVARYAVGNDRLALLVSAAFAGPLLDIAGEPSGGVHLVGQSQSGKSTGLYCAGSVWGRGDSEGQIRQWRATANGLEGLAAATSDTMLCLDEMSQASGREVGDIIYMLGNGSGKARAGRGGEARRRHTWRTLFLSTGEVSLATKMGEAGARAMAGQEVRLVNLPADAGSGMGTFQNLHDMPEPAALARHLREAARTHYGTAAPAFLAPLARHRAENVEELRGFLTALRNGFVHRHVPATADGQVRSVAGRFALIGAAGELARDYGVLSWPAGEAMRAAGACFEAWLQQRGGPGAVEERQAVAQVRAFIEAHGESRFTSLTKGAGGKLALAESRTVLNRAGFRYRVPGEGDDHQGDGGCWEYLILPEAWRAEICKGLEPKRVAQTLAARNLLVTEGGGHLTVQRRLPGLGKVRVYAVPGTILAGDDAE